MSYKPILLAAVALGLAPLAIADSFNNLSEATADSAEASARIVASGGQVAMGAVAIPLAGLGALAEAGGEAATEISSDLWDVANTPLKVDEAVVMAQPLPVPSAQPSRVNEANE